MTKQTEAMRAAQARISKTLASMVKGEVVPSHYKEDWNLRVPTAVYLRLRDADDKLRGMAAQLRKDFDIVQAAPDSQTVPEHFMEYAVKPMLDALQKISRDVTITDGRSKRQGKTAEKAIENWMAYTPPLYATAPAADREGK